MLDFRKIYLSIRRVLGIIIAIHGVIRIADIGGYIDFILSNYKGILPFDTLLIIGGALFPFLEFFIGLLICFNIIMKKAIISGFFISIIMIIFILLGGMYERLIYHTIVLIGLTFLYYGGFRNFSRSNHFI